ncbi:MAG: ABC transporter permease, partial [Terriglobia bacterium]
MTWLRVVASRWFGLFRKTRSERDLDEELRTHLEMLAEENARKGMSPEEAHYAARREFGGVAQTKEKYRDQRGIAFVEMLVQDIRYGLRQLRRNPGFTAVAVITLALGIGANTAIFSLIDAVMLRSMPVRDPSQLVLFRWKAHHAPRTNDYSMFGDCPGGIGGTNPSDCSFPVLVFEKIRSETKMFSGVTAFAGPTQLDVSGNGPPSIAHGAAVSGDYFSTLGVRAAMGRTIIPGDDSPTASPVVVLSYAYWQTAFDGERSVIGRTVVLNNVPFTIVGVADPAFTHLSPGKTQDLWLPLATLPRVGVSWGRNMKDIGNWWLVMLGRLKPGVRLSQAQAAASLLFRDEMLHGA